VCAAWRSAYTGYAMSSRPQAEEGQSPDRQTNPAPRSSLSSWLRWSADALLLVLLLVIWRQFIATAVVPAMRANSWPYSAYWIGPRLALEGHADLIYASPSVYGPEIARLNVTSDLLEVNLPTTYMAFLPLALLPIATAFHTWTVLSLTCFAVGWLTLLRAVRLPPSVALLLTAVVPLFQPFVENLLGQAYLVIFALVSLSFILGMNVFPRLSATQGESGAWRQILGGALLGVAGLFKLYYGLILALPAIVKRRYLFLVSGGLVVGLSVLVTAWAWGIGPWTRAIALSITWRDRPETVHTAFQTTNSLLGRLFRYDAQWNPGPVADLPWLAVALWWLVTILIVGVTLFALLRFRKHDAPAAMRTPAWRLLEPAANVPVASAIAPVSEGYHYALCIFPAVVIVAVLYEAWGRWLPASRLPRGTLAMSAGLLLAVALLGADWRYNVARADGWVILTHYPRLYGGMLLWLLTIVLMTRPDVVQYSDRAE
jgi:hypothetical protein